MSINDFKPLLKKYDYQKINFYMKNWDVGRHQTLVLAYASPASDKIQFACPYCMCFHFHDMVPIGDVGPRSPHCHSVLAPWTLNQSDYILLRVEEDEYQKYWIPHFLEVIYTNKTDYLKAKSEKCKDMYESLLYCRGFKDSFDLIKEIIHNCKIDEWTEKKINKKFKRSRKLHKPLELIELSSQFNDVDKVVNELLMKDVIIKIKRSEQNDNRN